MLGWKHQFFLKSSLDQLLFVRGNFDKLAVIVWFVFIHSFFFFVGVNGFLFGNSLIKGLFTTWLELSPYSTGIRLCVG